MSPPAEKYTPDKEHVVRYFRFRSFLGPLSVLRVACHYRVCSPFLGVSLIQRSVGGRGDVQLESYFSGFCLMTHTHTHIPSFCVQVNPDVQQAVKVEAGKAAVSA